MTIPMNNLLPTTLTNANNSNTATMPNSQFPPNMGPQLNGITPIIQPSSIVNLSNSNEVVIGPMTQYQGAVTIYQYMDATVEAKNRLQSPNIALKGNNSDNNTVTSTSRIPNTVLLLIVLLISIALGVCLYFFFKKPEVIQLTPAEIKFAEQYEEGTIPNLGNGHLVIDRKQWGALEATKLSLPLSHPVPYVLLSHIGSNSEPCLNVHKCSIKMRTLQDIAMSDRELPDIKGNFFLGNDGFIYVGRGWHYSNSFANHTIAVVFLGNYNINTPDEKQFDALEYLLAYGVTEKYLSHDYKLIAHNHTVKTTGPGENVYKRISKWPRWYPCSTPKYPNCGEEFDDWNPSSLGNQ